MNIVKVESFFLNPNSHRDITGISNAGDSDKIQVLVLSTDILGLFSITVTRNPISSTDNTIRIRHHGASIAGITVGQQSLKVTIVRIG